MEYTRTTVGAGLRDFLEIPYDQLEEMNLEAKEAAHRARVPGQGARGAHEVPHGREAASRPSPCASPTSKAGCTCSTTTRSSCSKSADNLTFDGSSIRGFSQQHESDLRLGIDWPAFYWLPVGRLRPGQGAGVRRSARARRHALPRRPARACSSSTPRRCSQKDGTRLPRAPTRSKASSSRAATPSATTTRPASSSSSPPAATTTRCPATRCARFIDTRRRSAARDGLPEREGPPRGRALAVRDELLLHRGADRRRPDPALQAALPPGRRAAWT